MEQKFCPVCKTPVFDNYIFCANCGANLKEAAAPSMGKQISIYLVSLLLPPLGLLPGIRYLRRDDPVAKRVGMITIILTIVSTVLTIWLSWGFVATVQKTINQQMTIPDLGY